MLAEKPAKSGSSIVHRLVYLVFTVESRVRPPVEEAMRESIISHSFLPLLSCKLFCCFQQFQ